MYYPILTQGLKEVIAEEYPDAKPVFKDVDTITDDFEMICYLLWMLDELQKFRLDNPARRGRWIGYVQGRLEALGVLTNKRNRELTSPDVKIYLNPV
ncbi:MAG TPA: hypothetical protein VJC06_03475 [Candidatus Paceibacterota bacterium]